MEGTNDDKVRKLYEAERDVNDVNNRRNDIGVVKAIVIEFLELYS